MNPVMRFVDATNRKDIDGIRAAFHPEFEMIVPQQPSRGFRGRDQEVKNMEYLVTTYPMARIEVLRMIEAGSEVWVENALTGCELEMATVVIFEIDRDTDTIIRGRYYSEPVNRGGLKIDDWMQNLSTTI
jgi:hypothetical protein